jgi:uncharacterized protein YcfJ
METTQTTTSRIHPLIAAAAVSVIVVSVTGAAAITGLLPSSHSAPDVALTPAQTSPTYAATWAPAAAPVGSAPQAAVPAAPAAYAQPVVAAAQPAPVVIKETVIREVPVHHVAKARPVQHYARNDTYYAPAARPAPQPNYLAIGTGAVVGGLVGNQVGNGNGRKLATVAGIIGGGFLGNQVANQNR